MNKWNNVIVAFFALLGAIMPKLSGAAIGGAEIESGEEYAYSIYGILQAVEETAMQTAKEKSRKMLIDKIRWGEIRIHAKNTDIAKLILVESKGNDYALGDKKLSNKAYGCLQIRAPYITDVNKRYGTSLVDKDVMGDRHLSVLVFHAYMNIYAKESRLGRKPTFEDLSRIHNGGPNGFKNESTLPYWQKVKSISLSDEELEEVFLDTSECRRI